MTSLTSSPSVVLVNNRPAASSLSIAEHFGKRHDSVLRDIRRITAECPDDFTAHNFVASEYIDETGRTLPMYNVFQDGFVLLVMGYTGREALQIKLVYIAAFNAMRDELAKKPTPAPKKKLPALPLRSLPRLEQKALPASPAEIDCCAEYRRLREDLDLITGVLRVLIPNLQFHGPRSGSFSQIEIILRVRSRVGDCLAALCEAQGHLREANRLALLIK